MTQCKVTCESVKYNEKNITSGVTNITIVAFPTSYKTKLPFSQTITMQVSKFKVVVTFFIGSLQINVLDKVGVFKTLKINCNRNHDHRIMICFIGIN